MPTRSVTPAAPRVFKRDHGLERRDRDREDASKLS
jgi:hypothetical protein